MAFLPALPFRRPLWLAALVFAIAAVAVAALARQAYHEQATATRNESISDLEAIANLKVMQLGAWLDERRGDARVLALNAGSALSADSSALVETMRGAYGYRYILLFSRECRLLQTFGEPPSDLPGDRLRELCSTTRLAGEVQFSDLYALPSAGGDVRLEFVVPMAPTRGGEIGEILVLGIDTERLLFPLIRAWPASTDTAETMLVRLEDGAVRYLSELRHRPGPPLALTLPLASPRLVAALAFRPGTSPIEGIDYRGEAVLAVARPVTGTPWMLVAKIDRCEALAEIDALAGRSATIAILVLAVAALAGLLLWRDLRREELLRDRQRIVDRQLLARHYDYLSKYANDAILLTDDAFRIIEVNDRAIELYGRSRDALIGLPSVALRAPAARHDFDDQLARVRGGDGFVFETVHVRGDGSEFPVEVSTRAIEVEGTRRYQAIVRDISERKAAEARLRAKTDELDRYFSSSLDLLCIADTDGRFRRLNPEWERVLGYPLSELEGKPFLEFVHPDDVGATVAALGQLAGGDDVGSFENRYRHKDGSWRWLEWRSHASADGMIHAVARDLTRRKAMEESLRRNESMVRLFFDLPLIGMAITSAETKRWMRFNDRLCEMLGYTREELVEKSWAELTHPDDLDADLAEFERVLGGEIDGYKMDKRYIRKDGAVIDARIDVRVVRKLDATIEFFVATVQDISEQKQAERSLRRQKDLYAALSETNQAIIRLHSREVVFEELCRVAVERAGFLFAWIGLLDSDRRMIRPVARNGEDRGYIDALRVSADADVPEGRGPGGRAVREGVHEVVNDLDAAADMGPWRDAARRAGVASLAALPVREGGEIIGLLCVYAGVSGYFDEAVLALLDEMAQDLGFALDNIAREQVRAAAVHKLQVAEARWNYALEGAGHGVWEWNAQTNRVFFSRQWKAMLGFSDDEIGDALQEWESRVHPDDLPAVRREIRRHLGGETPDYVAEHRLRCKDGRYKWILDRGKIMSRDAQGRPLTLIGTHTDITRMKEADRARHESEERFRRAIEEAPFPIMLHADDGEVVALSRAWTEISGYARQEIPTIEAWTDKAYGERAIAVRGEIAGLYDQQSRKDEGEYTVVTRDGQPRVWNFSSVALGHMADGRRIAMSIAADVTERHRAERALRESEERFRALVEQSLAGIYIVDNARLIYANPRTAQIFGYLPQEIIDKPVSELVAPEDRELVRGNIARRISGEVPSLQYTFRGLRKDGSIVNLGVHGSRAIIGDRPVVIGVMQDITDKLRAEAQISDYVARLERSIMGTVDAVSRMVEMRDPYTSGHERRVGQLAAAIARELGFSDDSAHGLEITGYVHDIGKITVPAEILSKPGKLSAIEFEMVKTHAEQGYQILKDVDFPWPVAEIVRQHHERMDGSGYPRGLKGEEILLEARILAVADVVESMATHRPYRPSLGIDAALAEIERNSGRSYDPRVAQACLRLFREEDYSLPT
jgi:PAS domain S-box-containing protein